MSGVADDEPVVVAVDQFEEIFTACPDDDERREFVDALMKVGENDERSIVVVAIRADFYSRCAAHPELSDLMAANHLLVGPMRRDELRRAIEQPADRAGLRIEPELVGRSARATSSASPAACRCSPPHCSSSGSGATAGGCGLPPTSGPAA